ncbi:MerR family transcriptional regulator [Actinomyces respiraculi]|uniref:MerR family transcriptional regulator n=1 Tax=Actinomyces respiraculi TaxID=2744574 RepID=UPI0018E0A572|nr:MerR family transcriptional regulator [Actinomyces respiraculi]
MCAEVMDHDDALLRIGLFSRLTSISVRMLRHYQEQGVLEPARTDPFTGHRFYTSAQLTRAHWIVRLRDAGLPVSEIGEVLAHRGDPERLRSLMSSHARRLAGQRARLEEMSAAFDRISTYLEESTMEIDIRRTHLPAMTVASLRRVLPRYSDEGELWQEISELMSRAGIAMSDPPLCGATFLDPEYRDSDVDVEVWERVAEPFTAVSPLECRELPACEVVMGTLRGGYDGMPEVCTAIGTHIAAHGLRTGPMFNIYRVGPAQDPDPTSWITDVCFPVEP